MSKMKSRNTQLKSALGVMAPKERVQEVLSIPNEDTTNRQGFAAYSLSDELRLISMLCTLKLEPQFYRSENQTMKELRDLIERIGSKDSYFVAQAIVYARCMADGMRSINHLGAALLAPFASGNEWAKRFYGRFDRKKQQGGCIYRMDDMSEIKDVFSALNPHVLSAAMKTGFRSVLESADTYQLAKYAKTTRDIANLVHPDPKKSTATITLTDKDVDDFCKVKGLEKTTEKLDVKVLDAILSGITVSADTWEVANSEAGQEVAKAVKTGKITKEEAERVLAEAKNQNFLELLKEGKLGILAALRNIRQMMTDPNEEVIEFLCTLISDPEKLRKGLIMPYQIDIAYEILRNEFSRYDKYNQVCSALLRGYETSIPNLSTALPGKTCIMVDCSGSMQDYCTLSGKPKYSRGIMATACEKAGLIAATIAKATGADIIRFGSRAIKFDYNRNMNVFELGRQISNTNMGGTNISTAWQLIRNLKLQYDRVIILSDNECNSRNWVSISYKQYVHDICSPYVYCVDFCAYGTVPLKGNKINYYFGYGYTMFEDIVANEFNPMQHIEKVKKVVI